MLLGRRNEGQVLGQRLLARQLTRPLSLFFDGEPVPPPAARHHGDQISIRRELSGSESTGSTEVGPPSVAPLFLGCFLFRHRAIVAERPLAWLGGVCELLTWGVLNYSREAGGCCGTNLRLSPADDAPRWQQTARRALDTEG